MHYTLSTESLVTRARNSCVAAFLSQSDFTHFIFIDADIAFEPSSVFKLIDANKDIVGGVYPKKKFDMTRVFEHINDDKAEQKSLEYVVTIEDKKHVISNSCIEVKELGTGFLMIKRSVFEEMINAYTDMKYDPLLMTVAQQKDKFYAFFDTEIDKERNHYISEDYYFCKRWIALGKKVYARIDIPLTHVGVLKYEGSFRTLFNEVKEP